jgi:superfamily I DNA/RNA helicase/RecB family exonuclease
VDVVRAAVSGGAGLDGVLVLTGSATAGAALLEEVTRGLPPDSVVGTDAPVRTVHSLAHAVVRLAAARVDAPPPRLRTGAEHDALVRETLLGEAADGAPLWPEQLRPALSTVGFARELRDLLLRSLERGIGPRELARLGRSAGRPAWVAAAGFFRRHEEQMALRSGLRGGESDVPEALNAAELVGAALDALTADPGLREVFRSRRLVAVDDAHHLDPLAAEFVAAVGGGADVLLVVEDGDQSVFRFRGADGGLARAVVDQGGRSVDLHVGRRMAPAVAAVAARIGSRLPGAARHRPRELAPGAGTAGAAERGRAADEGAVVDEGSVSVTVARSAAAEAALVADFLRRRHVLDGVDYGEMAVVSRSLPGVVDALLPALDAAGVPVVDAGAELPPAHDPVVAALLLLLRSALEGAPGTDAERTLALLSGPIGRADAVAMRRLRRGIRRTGIGGSEPSAETLRSLVLDEQARAPSGLTAVELAPVTRIRHARTAVLDSLRVGGTVEEVLWAAWSASRLERRLVRQAVAADPWSRSADRSLDAVVSLFDHAADYVDRVPGGSLALFCEVVSGEDLPAPRRADTRARGGAVSVLSAHAAVGRQWRSVAVCGVQDGRWPAPRRRSGLLGVDELVDLTEVAGDGPLPSEAERAVSSASARAAEERRLFYVACSRARSHLLVTAVESPEEGDVAPSRFVDEIADLATGDLATAVADPAAAGGDHPGDAVATRYAPTVFTLQHLAVDLRAALLDHSTDPADAAHAAGLLAGLRDAGVGEADPGTWYGAGEPSTTAPPFPTEPGQPVVVLSPSGFGALEECPLRWFLQKARGDSSESGSAASLIRGSAVHALTQAVEGGITEDALRSAVLRRAEPLTRARGWFAARGAESMVGMAEAFRRWRTGTRDVYTTAGVEEPFSFDVREGVRVRGRIDRLEATRSGEVVPVDVKTSTSAVTRAVAATHPQLALYQLAVAEGAVESAAGRAPGGGLLLYLGGREDRMPTERVQDPLGRDTAEELTDRVVEAGRATEGPSYTARVGPWCEHCDVRSSCPAQPEGQQVIG